MSRLVPTRSGGGHPYSRAYVVSKRDAALKADLAIAQLSNCQGWMIARGQPKAAARLNRTLDVLERLRSTIQHIGRSVIVGIEMERDTGP